MTPNVIYTLYSTNIHIIFFYIRHYEKTGHGKDEVVTKLWMDHWSDGVID